MNRLPSKDVTTLRDLAQRVAELAATDSNAAKIETWTQLNGLRSSTPPQILVHLWAQAWTEILPDVHLLCESEAGRTYERDLRRRIWMAENVDDDGVIEPIAHYRQTAWLDPYRGLQVRKRWAGEPEDGAAAFIPVIVEKRDIEKLGDPVLHHDPEQASVARLEAKEIFEPTLTVIKPKQYFAAKVVDEFSWLRGLSNTYLDLIDDPAWVHETLQRITDNFRKRFTVLESAELWGVADKADPLGSAGLRFVPDMPDWRTAADPATFAPTLADSWGFTCAEVLNCVSPLMHDAFAFDYDRQLMGLFRFSNVGCCERLDAKASLLHSVPNARKIAVSEWCDVAQAAENIGPGYVYSYRAAGVHFIQEPWNRDAARKEMTAVLDAVQGCPLEIVLNIGGTLGKGDRRGKLAEWCQMVRDLLRRRGMARA